MCRHIIMTILLLSLTSTVSYAADVMEVTVSGTGLSKPLALKDAMKNALESVSGALMSSDTVIINGKIIGDKAASHAAGYVERYELISQTAEPPYVTVTIKAYVALDSYSQPNAEGGAGEFKLNKNKAADAAIADSLKSLERLLSGELPRMLDGFDECIKFKLSNVNTAATFSAEISMTSNNECFKAKSARLYDFFVRLGLKTSRNTETGSITLAATANGSQFQVLNAVLQKYRDISAGKNITLTFEDEQKKALDIYKIDNYFFPPSTNEGSKEISISPAAEVMYLFEKNIEPKILERTEKLIAEISRKQDNGYYLGIISSTPAAKDIEKGLYVLSVTKNSPADKAGIKSGDFIYSINGTRIRNYEEAVAKLQNLTAPEAVMDIFKMEQRVKINTTLERRYKKENRGL